MEEMTDAQREEWVSELIDLEPQLSMYQLFLLLGVANNAADYGDPREPMWPYLACGNPLDSAPDLPESMLMQMAQAQALVRLDLLQMDVEGYWQLTPKGRLAAEWWQGWLLEDLKLAQPTPIASVP